MNNLNLVQHCNLCDKQKRNFELGIHCGLTNTSPNFNKNCNKIKLDKQFLIEIEKTNIEYVKLTKSKFDVIGGVLFFPLIGIIILFLDYLFYKMYFEPYFSTGLSSTGFAIMAIIFIAGIIFIAKGSGPLINYNQQKNIISKKKEDLDRISKLYGILYEIDYVKKKNPFEQNLYVKNIKLKKIPITSNKS